jgi:hypothetical protein
MVEIRDWTDPNQGFQTKLSLIMEELLGDI